MKTIVCHVALFDLHQNIVLIDGDNQSVVGISNTENLGSDIAMLCDKHDVDSIHLYGSNDYLNQAIQEIKEYNITKYGNRPLNIEVN